MLSLQVRSSNRNLVVQTSGDCQILGGIEGLWPLINEYALIAGITQNLTSQYVWLVTVRKATRDDCLLHHGDSRNFFFRRNPIILDPRKFECSLELS
jgi:hypothetical protein